MCLKYSKVMKIRSILVFFILLAIASQSPALTTYPVWPSMIASAGPVGQAKDTAGTPADAASIRTIGNPS